MADPMVVAELPEVKFIVCVPDGIVAQPVVMFVFWKFKPLERLVDPLVAISADVDDDAFTTRTLAVPLFGPVVLSLLQAAMKERMQTAPTAAIFVLRRYNIVYLHLRVCPSERDRGSLGSKRNAEAVKDRATNVRRRR